VIADVLAVFLLKMELCNGHNKTCSVLVSMFSWNYLAC